MGVGAGASKTTGGGCNGGGPGGGGPGGGGCSESSAKNSGRSCRMVSKTLAAMISCPTSEGCTPSGTLFRPTTDAMSTRETFIPSAISWGNIVSRSC
eukprot:scaffold1183_cov418-Prasinococcus_capsulatus_cf.AAC.20